MNRKWDKMIYGIFWSGDELHIRRKTDFVYPGYRSGYDYILWYGLPEIDGGIYEDSDDMTIEETAVIFLQKRVMRWRTVHV